MHLHVSDAATEDMKTGLLKTTEVCGTTQGPVTGIVKPGGGMSTWNKAIAAKGKDFKAWKTGKGTRASYNAAKFISRHALHHACQETNKKAYKNIDPKSSEVYRLANQFRGENTVGGGGTR